MNFLSFASKEKKKNVTTNQVASDVGQAGWPQLASALRAWPRCKQVVTAIASGRTDYAAISSWRCQSLSTRTIEGGSQPLAGVVNLQHCKLLPT
jgi:hypothetical protein